MNGIMNEMLGSNGLDKRRATADLAWAFPMNSPWHIRSNSGKKGTHAVSLAILAQRARLRLYSLLFKAHRVSCFKFFLPMGRC
jgi:hypothetical protein